MRQHKSYSNSGSSAFVSAPGLSRVCRAPRSTCTRRASYKSCSNRSTSGLETVKRRLPTWLTLSRVAMTPVLAAVYLAPPFAYQRFVTVGLFALSALTDLLDGILARRWNACTRLGAFLDPVADKLLVSAVLVCVTARLQLVVLPPATAVILCREIFVSALREWMAGRGESDTVQVGFLGKVKTTTQMLALVALLAAENAASSLATFGVVVLVVAAALSIVSAIQYIRAALPVLIESE